MAIGDMLTAFEGNPSYSLVGVTKSPQLQRGINLAMGQAAGLNTNAQGALSDYISKYLAGEGAARTRTNQEITSLDQYYNGSMASQLAALRAQQQQATLNAAGVATQQALRGLNLGRLGQQGSGGSYDARMAIGAMQPIAVQAALTNANQQRSDLDFLSRMQMANVGAAQGLANAQAAYRMAPVGMEQQVFANNLNNLSGLSSLNNSNHIYGVQQDKSTLDKWANFLNAAQGQMQNDSSMAMNAYGAYRGGGGGGGGGGL